MTAPGRQEPLDLVPIEARLAELVAAEQSAGVVGEWRRNPVGLSIRASTSLGDEIMICGTAYSLGEGARGIAEFVASSRADVPALLAEVRRLRAQVEEIITGTSHVEAGRLPNGEGCAYASSYGSELWHEHDHAACLDTEEVSR